MKMEKKDNIESLQELMASLKEVESTLEGSAELRSLSWNDCE